MNTDQTDRSISEEYGEYISSLGIELLRLKSAEFDSKFHTQIPNAYIVYKEPPPEDDVLEYALNNGLRSAADKFCLELEKVYEIVKKFKTDIGDLCSCEKDSLRGIISMCAFCDSHNNRIRI